MKNLAANTLTVLIVLGFALAAAIGYGVQQFRAAGPSAAPVVIVVPPGAGLEQVSTLLADAGVIADPMIFRLGARYSGQAAKIRFGEYETPAGASMEEVLALLVSGRSVQHLVTAPEGLTAWEVVELLKAEPLLTGEIGEIPPEGSLAPDTYSFQRGESRMAVLGRMSEAQKRILAAAWEARAADLPIATPEEALILASIIEKETGVNEERWEVASVFVNRLRRGMRLQTDPAVIYGLTKGRGKLGRGLKRSELQRQTDYNTYLIEGLPPTPIANPGKAAIAAAVQPAQTDYLYFVADGSGGHAFARTLKEHNRNVAKWRKIEKQRANQ